MAPIDRLVKRFVAPLKAAEADTDVIKSKSFDMIARCAIHCPLFSWLLVCVVETFSCSKLSWVGKYFSSCWASLLPSSIKWKAGMNVFHTWHSEDWKAFTSSTRWMLLKCGQASMLILVSTFGGLTRLGDPLRNRKQYKPRSSNCPSTSQVQDDSVKTAKLTICLNVGTRRYTVEVTDDSDWLIYSYAFIYFYISY